MSNFMTDRCSFLSFSFLSQYMETCGVQLVSVGLCHLDSLHSTCRTRTHRQDATEGEAEGGTEGKEEAWEEDQTEEGLHSRHLSNARKVQQNHKV